MRGYCGVGLYNPKNCANVGGALRAAGCYGANFVMVAGSRYHRNAADTMASFRHLPVWEVESLTDRLPVQCTRVAVEIVPGAADLREFRHPERALYIFGPEDGSIPADVLEKCKHKVFVPTNRCMNLAATVNVILYDRMAKSSK